MLQSLEDGDEPLKDESLESPRNPAKQDEEEAEADPEADPIDKF
jgi:hypothetical protein